jgi:hypothetical protein
MADFSVRYDPEEEIIRVEMRGEFDAQMLSASTAALVEEIKRSACTRVLMDHRQATPKLSVVEQYRRPEVAVGLGVPRSCRFAIVYREAHDAYGFIETVSVNRGMIVKIFQGEEEALEWLRK